MWIRVLLLTSLYLSQGLPFGFFTQALPALLRQMGLSLPAISMAGLLTFPWMLKFLWAPWVDRWSIPGLGRRRSWILPLQGAAALLMFAMAAIDPERGLPLVMIGFVLANLFAATQDIATDGLAVELLSESERGLGNGVQVAGYRVGMILGGGLMLVLFGRLGWTLTFAAMGAMLVLASLPIALYPEPERPAPPAAEFAMQDLWTLWRRPGMPSWLGALVLYKAGDYLGNGMVKPMLVDQGLDLADIGVLIGTVGFLAGLLGALAGGLGVSRLGRLPALVGFGALQALAIAFYAVPALGLGGPIALYGAVVAEHFIGGMATVSLFTTMMDLCRGESAGTDYTLQASVVVMATSGASALSGFSAQALGYPPHFLLAGCVSLLGLTPMILALTSGGFRVMKPA